MARGHWQIQKAHGETRRSYGKVETLPLCDAPPGAVDLAVRAANLIGRGLYGVDIKEAQGRFVVMEVNDNPSIEAGYEDAVLQDELYVAVMRTFFDRLERRGAPVGER
jgi:glutathione synthase/RimK-type ligase-like ATP-grasp enzyme